MALVFLKSFLTKNHSKTLKFRINPVRYPVRSGRIFTIKIRYVQISLQAYSMGTSMAQFHSFFQPIHALLLPTLLFPTLSFLCKGFSIHSLFHALIFLTLLFPTFRFPFTQFSGFPFSDFQFSRTTISKYRLITSLAKFST